MNHNEMADRLVKVADAVRALPDACPDLAFVFVEEDRINVMPDYSIMLKPSADEAFAQLAVAFGAEVDIQRGPLSRERCDLLTEFEHHGLTFYATRAINTDKAYALMDALDRVLPDKKTVTLSAQDFESAVTRIEAKDQETAL